MAAETTMSSWLKSMWAEGSFPEGMAVVPAVRAVFVRAMGRVDPMELPP